MPGLLPPEDIRWHQRLDSYQRALAQLNKGLATRAQRPLSDLEQQGLIQAFEFTHEVAWNVMKDYLRSVGKEGLIGSRDSTRAAFAADLLEDGEGWMEMIQSRNLSSHTYNPETADLMVQRVVNRYAVLLQAFAQKMHEIKLHAASA